MKTTLQFLNQLKHKEYASNLDDTDLTSLLFQYLSEDGFNCQDTSLKHRFLSSEQLTPSDSQFATYVILVMICIICAAAANGLTQGLLSLDLLEMKIKAKTGTEEEKKQAKRVLPIIERHHLLLVSLMTWNASANEALPIFLDALVPGWLAIVLSVTIVLFVGEIIPAALLTGPNQLKLASLLVPVVYVVMAIFSPIAYPVSLLLDFLLGHDHGLTIYNKTELATMVKIQHEEGKHDEYHDIEASNSLAKIHKEEVTIIEGALKFRDMLVREIMTPVKTAFTLQADQKLSFQTMADIFKAGYSRIPVWDKDPNDIIGLILTKDLIFVDPGDETPVRIFVSLFGRAPIVVWHDQKLGEVLSVFKQSKGHLAIVRDVNNESEKDPFYEVVGIVTLEDIVEEILGVDIEDEHDVEELDINHYVTKAQRNRDANFARLKLLHPKLATELLSLEEISAVTSYLITEIKQIKQYYKNDTNRVRDLVSSAKVVTLSRHSLTPLKPEEDDIIYHSGQVATRFILILNGKLTILVGKDQFHVESGPWSVLGADTLTVKEGEYVPDFTAYISSETVRIVIFYPFVQKIAHHHSSRLNAELLSSDAVDEEIPPTTSPTSSNSPSKSPRISSPHENGIELSPPIKEDGSEEKK